MALLFVVASIELFAEDMYSDSDVEYYYYIANMDCTTHAEMLTKYIGTIIYILYTYGYSIM